MNAKRDKFVALAEARVNKTLKQLQLVGNLSNRSAYEFDQNDVRKMFAALQKGLDAAKSRFSPGADLAGGDFHL